MDASTIFVKFNPNLEEMPQQVQEEKVIVINQDNIINVTDEIEDASDKISDNMVEQVKEQISL